MGFPTQNFLDKNDTTTTESAMSKANPLVLEEAMFTITDKHKFLALKCQSSAPGSFLLLLLTLKASLSETLNTVNIARNQDIKRAVVVGSKPQLSPQFVLQKPRSGTN